jgi:hypothetical protein
VPHTQDYIRVPSWLITYNGLSASAIRVALLLLASRDESGSAPALTHAAIAAHLGVRRVTVSRAIIELVKCGVLATQYQGAIRKWGIREPGGRVSELIQSIRTDTTSPARETVSEVIQSIKTDTTCRAREVVSKLIQCIKTDTFDDIEKENKDISREGEEYSELKVKNKRHVELQVQESESQPDPTGAKKDFRPESQEPVPHDQAPPVSAAPPSQEPPKTHEDAPGSTNACEPIAAMPSKPNAQPVASQAPTEETQDSGSAADVRKVFDAWRNILSHPKARLDDRRRRAIKRALSDYGLDDCVRAIHGIRASSFHMGDNADGKVYDDLCLIFRDAEHIERFIALSPVPENHQGDAGKAPDNWDAIWNDEVGSFEDEFSRLRSENCVSAYSGKWKFSTPAPDQQVIVRGIRVPVWTISEGCGEVFFMARAVASYSWASQELDRRWRDPAVTAELKGRLAMRVDRLNQAVANYQARAQERAQQEAAYAD